LELVDLLTEQGIVLERLATAVVGSEVTEF
jgi:hypothetical protein